MNTTELNGKKYQMFGEDADGTITLKPVLETVRECIQTLPAGYRELAFKNTSENALDRDANNLKFGLKSAFVWSTTSEGGDFWRAVSEGKLPPIPKPLPHYKVGDVYGNAERFGVRDGNSTRAVDCWVHTVDSGVFIPRSDRDVAVTEEVIEFNVFDVLDGTYKRECIREFRDKIRSLLTTRDSFDDNLWDQMFHNGDGLLTGEEAKAHAKLCELLDIIDDEYEPEC